MVKSSQKKNSLILMQKVSLKLNVNYRDQTISVFIGQVQIPMSESFSISKWFDGYITIKKYHFEIPSKCKHLSYLIMLFSEKQLLQKVFSRKFAANKAKKETKSDQWFELNIYSWVQKAKNISQMTQWLDFAQTLLNPIKIL